MLVASCLLSVIVFGTFATLFTTIIHLRDAASLAGHSETVLATANRLERLVVDLETGQRGYIITGDQSYLQPWDAARKAATGEAAELQRLADLSGPVQNKRADEIAQGVTSYLRDYSIPVVEAAQRDPSAARADPRIAQGERRLEALRTQFDHFVAAQHAVVADRSAKAHTAASRALIVSVGSTAAWLVLILSFAGYLTRVIVRPVRGAAMMAGDLAGGDLTVRMPETSPAEIGALERAFNTMAGTMEENRAAVQRNAEEQRALRRVATLVARGVAPEEVFSAVAAELGRLIGVTYGGTLRFEPDNTMTQVGGWGTAGTPVLPTGSQWSLEGNSLGAQVARTGRPARLADYAAADSDIARWVATHGFKSGVGCPVVVEGRLWGMVVVLSDADDPLPEGTGERMLDFTELLGTAIANAESREELRASRARVVTASDETRRRIERNLHDGTQQHLISLGLELRAIEETVPDGPVREQVAASSRRLTEIVEELQEISRGLHPAILSRAGLEPALRALRRRSALPIELDLHLPGRLPEPVAVAVYYTVSEAVTNAAKHAKASAVRVGVETRDETVCLSVSDDGVGGAGPGPGSGLLGIRDRVEALGGRVQIHSPAGKGTRLLAQIPVSR